jgi:mRNA interferase MazF
MQAQSKDFDSWNTKKKNLQIRDELITFHEAEIWWCGLGLNVGFEEDSKNEEFERPVLVLKKFSKDLFIGIPLSTKIKEGIFYINFEEGDFKYSVLLSQTKVLSSKRLLRKLSKISRGKFGLIKRSYRKLLNL